MSGSCRHDPPGHHGNRHLPDPVCALRAVSARDRQERVSRSVVARARGAEAADRCVPAGHRQPDPAGAFLRRQSACDLHAGASGGWPAGAGAEQMTSPRQLADAPWLTTGPAGQVLSLLNGDGEEARVVGGAVRNALMGLDVGEIDIATTAVPDQVVRRARAAGYKSVPTGIEHGTVTLVVDGTPIEVTSLRED